VQDYLWRDVDQDGVVLDILVQARRDGQAAKRFFKRLLAALQYEPRVIVTDKLRSYGVAQRQMLPGVEHRQSRHLNNRAENSHRPTRRLRWSPKIGQIAKLGSPTKDGPDDGQAEAIFG
jgi:putative transposase